MVVSQLDKILARDHCCEDRGLRRQNIEGSYEVVSLPINDGVHAG